MKDHPFRHWDFTTPGWMGTERISGNLELAHYTFKWNDDEATFVRELLTKMYGQVSFKEVFFELNVTDERFADESSLPWDANASIDEEGRLVLNGMTEVSGGGIPFMIQLPEDVELDLQIWKRE